MEQYAWDFFVRGKEAKPNGGMLAGYNAVANNKAARGLKKGLEIGERATHNVGIRDKIQKWIRRKR